MLFDKRIVALDLLALEAGTQQRSQVEERMKALMNEVEKSPDVILFIDELHTIIGVGGASNMLKRALARGEIQCIGATTLDEYRQHIEKDGALDRRFQKIMVKPTMLEDTIEILLRVKDRYEEYHNVLYSEEAVELAVELSNLYITDRFFPGKAIDVLDLAGARVHINNVKVPQDILDLEEQMEKIWEEKKQVIKRQRFEDAAQLRDREKKLQKKLDEAKRKWEAESEVHDVLDEDIYEAFSETTGIDIDKIRNREDVPRRITPGDEDDTAEGVPRYEKLQTGSVLHGEGVKVERGFGFVLLPHNEEFQDIFDHAIGPAMETNGLIAHKADDIFKPGLILSQVWESIRTAEVIVADVSSQNPNVIMELGLCYGIQRNPILLLRDPAELPFNLRSLRYIKYENNAGGIARLKDDLTTAIGVVA